MAMLVVSVESVALTSVSGEVPALATKGRWASVAKLFSPLASKNCHPQLIGARVPYVLP
jgi:hypothetical protein